MTAEEYRKQVQQRWRESMALLGFDDPGPEPEDQIAEQEPAPEPQPPAAALEPPAPAMPAKAIESFRDIEPPPAEVQAASRDMPMDTVEDGLTLEVQRSAGIEETTQVQPKEARSRAAENADDSPRGRRGRRGRRGGKHDTQDQAESGRGERPGDQSERSEAGKKGRGRQRGAKRGPAAEPPEDETPQEEAAHGGDIGDDEPTDLSEWDVPSWQDLIASLYRPER